MLQYHSAPVQHHAHVTGASGDMPGVAEASTATCICKRVHSACIVLLKLGISCIALAF